MSTTFCPDCDGPIKFSIKPDKGQQVICPRCRANLVVASLDPLELDWALSVSQAAGRKKKTTYKADCPECAHIIKLNHQIFEGQRIVCGTCNTSLEVVNIAPLEFEIAAKVALKQTASKSKGRRSEE